MISIVMPVHNQQDILLKVLQGLYDNASPLVEEVIIVLDGCTDASPDIVLKFATEHMKVSWQVTHAPDVWEVKACNIGYKMATQLYILNIQDDMIITEPYYDVRMMKPMWRWDDVFAVTALAACDIHIDANDHMQWDGLINDHNYPRNLFGIRDTVNRGPLLLRHDMLRTLNYLDEIYAPQGMDDMDVCFRAWQHGWVSGVYTLPAFFDINDGTTRKNPCSAMVTADAWVKNERILLARYRDIITGPKHSENRELE